MKMIVKISVAVVCILFTAGLIINQLKAQTSSQNGGGFRP